MKRKILILLLSFAFVLALGSCSKDDDSSDSCEHAYYLSDQIDGNCVEKGRAIYVCKLCGETKAEELPFGEHSFSYVESETAPTCTENGERKSFCGICCEIVTEELLATGHTVTAYAEVAANCTTVGYTGGSYCSSCEIVLEERTELPVNGEHVSVAYEDKEPDCGNVGYTGGTYCSLCETHLTERTEIPVQGEHVSADYDYLAPTCGEVGYTGGTYCSVCQTKLTERTELPATGEHTEVDIPAVPATCTKTGLSAGKQCSVCEIFTVEQTETEMTPHDYSYEVVSAPEYQVAGVGKYTCADCLGSYEVEIPALPYQPSDIWQGDTASGYASGDGTKDSPYVIETAAQLKYFASQVDSNSGYNNKYFILAKDIVLNDTTDFMSWSKTNAPANKWYPIGATAVGFCGNFDGQGHTVYGLYCYQKKMSSGTNYYAGLFGNISKGSIKNLNVVDAYVYSDHGTAGGIVCSVDASDTSITIENCHFSGTVISSGHAGGIMGTVRCGWVGHDRVNGSIQKVCHNGYLTIKDCTAKGSVASNDMNVPNYDYYVGGIAGNLYYSCGSVTIDNCTNYATITSKSHGGGVFGVLTPSSSNKDSVTFSMTNCVNKGDVTANCDAGGVASRFSFSGQGNYYDTVTLSNCGNMGKIVSYGKGSNASVGGAFGDIRVSGVQYGYVHSIYNTGDVDVKGTAYLVGGIAGGLSLQAKNMSMTFNNSFNSGNVTVESASYVGGLFGYSSTSNTNAHKIEACYNSGNITYAGQTVGGLVGYGSGLTVKDCYNTGNITGGDKKVGGLFGYAYRITATTCYNAGTVTGTGTYVGAIAGQNENGSYTAFFKAGCATDGNGNVQGTYGSDRNSTGSTTNSLSESAMYNSNSYKNFDFSKVWNAPSDTDGVYPTLKKVVKAPVEEENTPDVE